MYNVSYKLFILFIVEVRCNAVKYVDRIPIFVQIIIYIIIRRRF